jgi:uncharacterized membrane protein YtjA (UPF0391 family)
VAADPHPTAIPTPAPGAVVASVEGWEGLRARAAMPEKVVLFLLVLVFAVEVPIHWVAFEPFHGVGSSGSGALNATLAISVGVLMLVVPHLVGRALRERGATGAGRPAVPLLLGGVHGHPGHPARENRPGRGAGGANPGRRR